MQNRTVPNTEIDVSPICMGTMTFGNPVGEDDAVRLVHWALDHDVHFLDTADMYEGYDRFLGSPGGVSETILGKALAGRRDKAIVTSKVGNPVGGKGYEGKGLSPDHMRHQFDSSLKRMQTDYLDFYEMHRPDPDTPQTESIAVMAEFIEAGKLRHWGISNFDAPRIHEIVRLCDDNGWPRPVISQPPYSWLKRDEESESLPACREFDIAITPYQPLQGGLLTGKYRRGGGVPAGSRADESTWLKEPDDALYDRLEQFETEAQSAGRTPTTHAIQWLLDQPGVCAVVVGLKRIDQLEQLIAGLNGA